MDIDNIEAVARSVATLVLSPHCDDAPLSVGAALVTGLLGSEPAVAVVFSRSRFTRDQPGNGPVEEVTLLRAVEELSSAALAGYQASFLGFAEPAVRNRWTTREEIFDLAYRVEEDVEWGGVLRALQEILGRCRGLVLAPLGCGGHVDHRLVNKAALWLAGKNANLSLGFYEDLPYADHLSDAQIESLLPTVLHRELRPLVVTEGLGGKLALLDCYPSQPDHSVEVRRYWDRRGGERLWLPAGYEHRG